jgi:hypothetical protein
VRSKLLRGSAFALIALVIALVAGWAFYPTDRTPKGAYYRVVTAVNQRDAEAVFPYLETAAQHAAFSIHHYNADAVKRIREDYPDGEREQALEARLPMAEAHEGPGVFALYATRLGWMDRLRRDLSGVARVEIDGERATVETVRGTRYAFRKRDNGMWGLTLFTGKLVTDAEKAARDFSVIDTAAKDFAAARAQ